MLTLIPMTGADFQDFMKIIVSEYADDISKNSRLAGAAALVQAEQEINAILLHGAETPGQTLLSIYSDHSDPAVKTGYFWLSADALSGVAFLYDFYIFPCFRNQGLSKESMEALEKYLSAQGIRQIKLRVAVNNYRAKHVYENAGYRVNGFSMNKLI